MTIAEDKGQKDGKHDIKNRWFRNNGIRILQLPLPVGDYIKVTEDVLRVINRRGEKLKKMDLLGVTKISVDTKQDLEEICNNICGKAHARFRDEVILAQENGIKLYVLIEHGLGIEKLEDVQYWQNPRLLVMKRFTENGVRVTKQAYPKATTGATLYKSMKTMEEKYDVKFLFCEKRDTGKKIVELLGGD